MDQGQEMQEAMDGQAAAQQWAEQPQWDQWQQGPANGVPEQAPPQEAAAEPEAKEKLIFPNNYFNSIMGANGSTIADIRKGGADVFVKQLDNRIEVHVSGTKEQVDEAKKRVREVAHAEDDTPRNDRWDDWGGGGWGEDRNYNRRNYNNNRKGGAGDESETLTLDVGTFGCIVGPGGAKIKEVRKDSGAYVNIEKLSDRVEVRISGSAEQVARAKTMVTRLAGGKTAEASEVTENLSFEKTIMGGLIGPGGKRITMLRKKSGADVSVKKLDEQGQCEVTLSGTASKVEQAKALLGNLVEAIRNGGPYPEDEEDAEEDLSDDDVSFAVRMEVAKQIVGKGGSMLKRIRSESGASVEVDDNAEPSPVYIAGNIKTVDRARAMILDVMNGNARENWRGKVEWEDEEYMKIPFEASKKLIGKGGSRVREIEKESWAKVDISRSVGGAPVMVRISGSFDAVEQACNLIEEALPFHFKKQRTDR